MKLKIMIYDAAFLKKDTFTIFDFEIMRKKIVLKKVLLTFPI